MRRKAAFVDIAYWWKVGIWEWGVMVAMDGFTIEESDNSHGRGQFFGDKVESFGNR